MPRGPPGQQGAPPQGHHTWHVWITFFRVFITSMLLSFMARARRMALFSSFVRHKCHQALCEDMDERLILPEEDFSGQHRLADVTGHTAGFQGDQSTHLPQLGHHHQDATAEGCANHLGGDSIHHCSLLFGYHQWFPRAPSSQHCVQFLLFFLNRKRT